jgi:class 3 adenylate cyclase
VHVGRAVHSDDDYFGYTVNKTARLASAASGNEILVSQGIADQVGGVEGLSVGEQRELNLKGLPGTHIAYPLTQT